jgi:hypothetical protein
VRKLILALCLILVLGVVAGAAARSSWNLGGTWYDPAGDPWVLHQTGSTLTWYAHSLDGHTWAHDFKGQISGSTFSGTYQDRPGYDRHFHGTITGRITDACHMTIWLTVVGGSSVSGPLEKKPCRTRFRFAWKAQASRTEDRNQTTHKEKLRGGGTFVIDGIGTLKAATGTLRLDRLHAIVPDTWLLRIVGGRYHEDPVPTAEPKVKADSVHSGVCDAKPNGTLTLVDGGGKRPDHALLVACGQRILFENRTGVIDGTATVLLAELK